MSTTDGVDPHAPKPTTTDGPEWLDAIDRRLTQICEGWSGVELADFYGVARMVSVVRAAQKALRKAEHGGVCHRYGLHCPVCSATQGEPHHTSCEVAAALKLMEDVQA